MGVHEIYTPPIEQSDWSEFTTMVQKEFYFASLKYYVVELPAVFIACAHIENVRVWYLITKRG